jgi:nitroimidazol reductase NimA-like FMN-containing flavoprotein (pyridoxamine 5'-phosphate oxidase superfamily)
MRARVITDKKELVEIILRCQWCHLAMTDPDGHPYVLPMNFGYMDDVIYLHGKQQGKKIESLKAHPEVCINFSTDQQLRYQNEEVACSWSMKYRSVLCYGTAEFITDPEEKAGAMHYLMAQYSNEEFKFNPPSIREVCVWKVRVEKYDGRAYGL